VSGSVDHVELKPPVEGNAEESILGVNDGVDPKSSPGMT